MSRRAKKGTHKKKAIQQATRQMNDPIFLGKRIRKHIHLSKWMYFTTKQLISHFFSYHELRFGLLSTKGDFLMKRTLPLTALFLSSSLMFTPSVLAEETESGAAQTTSAQTVEATEALTPIPSAIQKTMDKLFTLQPELKKLNIITSISWKDAQRFIVHLSDRPEVEIGNSKEYTVVTLEFDEKTGELLSFNIQATAWASEKSPSRQLAQDTAERFLAQWFSTEDRQQFGKPIVHNSTGSAIHHEDDMATVWHDRLVDFPFIINGIPLDRGGVNLRVD